MDLSAVKMFILDEADNFFMDKTREDEIMLIDGHLKALTQKVQYVFFSATYDKAISEKLSTLISEANQINLRPDQIKLDNVQQYYFKADKG